MRLAKINTNLPYKDGNVILLGIIRRERRNGSSNGYLAIYLNKTSTKKVVASGCLICVTLHAYK
jgi:hypothetical protein